jgi:ribosomal protein S18 acetylase RimI-like enzyme
MNCEYCGAGAGYRCSICGKIVCGEHMKLRLVCPACIRKNTVNHTIVKITSDSERAEIREFVQLFWGEQEQLTFDRRSTVAELPAYVAKTNKIAGFVSFMTTEDAIIIAALGILPKYQGAGIGHNLIAKVEREARRLQKTKLLVSTSNDDLPALAFYQSLGFQIFEVKPNVVAEKHGKILGGIGGLPLRDELRLQKILR